MPCQAGSSSRVHAPLGHASVTITLDRYGHLFAGSEKEAAGLLDRHLERPKPARVDALRQEREWSWRLEWSRPGGTIVVAARRPALL